jgi:glutamate-5-semialdehyde dehydrogenase
MSEVVAKAQAARQASIELAMLSSEQKNETLKAIADAIWRNRSALQEENGKDLSDANVLLKEGKISRAVVQRLKLDEMKIESIVSMVRSVTSLEDPVGKTDYAVELDDGLELFRVSSPIGVIGFIFESRPDALVQIASLCLKSGNAVLLKGGSEVRNSNLALYRVIRDAAAEAGAPEGWIQLLEARADVAKMLELDEHVDLVIPRGSNSFVRYIQTNTKIPVLGHAEGICHIYVDVDADIGKAVDICFDAKVQYPSVCNAVDRLLVHREVAETFLPQIVDKYLEAEVEVRGDPETIRILGDRIKEASEADWTAEYLDYIVAVKIVDDLDEAIDHVNRYGSHHTDTIVTENEESAFKFMGKVDSASVIWNASTRFSDGYRYGLGAEVGISTGKIHARGPTGLEGLTIYKYHLVGTGQIVRAYTGKGAKKFKHLAIDKSWKDLVR